MRRGGSSSVAFCGRPSATIVKFGLHPKRHGGLTVGGTGGRHPPGFSMEPRARRAWTSWHGTWILGGTDIPRAGSALARRRVLEESPMTSRFSSTLIIGALGALGVVAWSGCGTGSEARYYCDGAGCY